MKSLRVTGLLATLLLVASAPACSDDDSQPADTSDAGGEPGSDVGGGSAEAGTPSSSGTSSGGTNAGGTSASAGAGGEEPVGGNDVGGAPNGEGGASSEAGAPAGGAGPVVPTPNICEQAITHLTSCGQLDGATMAGQNCNPDYSGSQCVVPCLLSLSCDELTEWPAPILGCSAACGF